MAVETCLLTEGGLGGSYWAGLNTQQRSRYYAGGSYLVYASMKSWWAAYSSNIDYRKYLKLEIQGNWVDDAGAFYFLLAGFRFIELTTSIDGVINPDSYHFGVQGGGYQLRNSYQYSACLRTMVPSKLFGIDLVNNHATEADRAFDLGDNTQADYCIGQAVIGNATARAFYIPTGVNVQLRRSIAINSKTGIYLPSRGGQAGIVSGNLAYGCDIGFTKASNAYGETSMAIINNISVGNTLNWDTDKYDSSRSNTVSSNNAGEAGDAVWEGYNDAGSSIVMSPSDFASAGSDFRPALATSPQVEVGDPFTGTLMLDIAQNVVPNYINGATDTMDIGPFEYDHGYGLAPKTVSIEISGIITGSDLAIYKSSDNTEIVAPTIISGSSFSTTYTYTGDTVVTVKIRNSSGATKYKPYTAQGVISENGLSMIVAQIENPIAK